MFYPPWRTRCWWWSVMAGFVWIPKKPQWWLLLELNRHVGNPFTSSFRKHGSLFGKEKDICSNRNWLPDAHAGTLLVWIAVQLVFLLQFRKHLSIFKKGKRVLPSVEIYHQNQAEGMTGSRTSPSRWWFARHHPESHPGFKKMASGVGCRWLSMIAWNKLQPIVGCFYQRWFKVEEWQYQ